MPFFVVHESGQPDRLFEVHTPKVIVGRATDADLVLPNVSVSRQHARLDTTADGDATLTTLTDDNPVYDGNEPLAMCAPLRVGQRIRVGRYGLTYLHEAHLDLFQIQQLTDMPRFNRRGGNDAETHVLSAALQRRLMQIEIRREFGALVGADGTQFRLGTDARVLGPGGDIPCPGRWGGGAAATVSWAGAQHQVARTSMFAKLLINGESHKQRMLEPGDTVEINGAVFTYAAKRQRKRKKARSPRPS